MLTVNDPDSGIGVRPPVEHIARPVLGAIVHRDDLEPGESLAFEAGDALIEIGHRVVDREQDGDDRVTHGHRG
jgi:hypothetical protein